MGHSNIRIKVRRRKVAHLAAYSRKFTVTNNVIGSKTEDFQLNKDSITIKTTKLHGKIYYQVPWKNRIATPGKVFIVNDKPDKYGLRFKLLEHEWDEQKHPQTKSLTKKDFGQFDYKLPKMSLIQYQEKLVEHKLARWERKHPKPIKDDAAQDDIFAKEYMIPWEASKSEAEKRIRDFVVSIYDKLPLVGRYEMRKDGMASYQDKKIADIKDKTGEGHTINELNPIKSKLLKVAQKITNKEKHVHKNLIATNLKDHKRQKGRIILPQAA